MAGALFWLFFTLSMAGWWIYLSLGFLSQIESLDLASNSGIVRQKKMIIWEGATWMLLLIGGGFTLIYLIVREQRNSQKLRLFLATFSHDLKTAITSLHLQTEILREDIGDRVALRRLESDVVRLELQLENALFLSKETNLQLFIEKLSLQKLVNSLSESWPSMQIRVSEDAILSGDRQALESVFSNLFQNAQVHGKAKNVLVYVKGHGGEFIEIGVADDGKGFEGDLRQLGQLFERHNPSSGSGVGLYTSTHLVRQMKGKIGFSRSEQGGFCTTLILPGELL
jgi:signal transduction histidine kinase